MAVSALGVGSGLDLESLVTQLVRAERTPREESIANRQNTAEVTLSGYSRLKSDLSSLMDSLAKLSDPRELQARTAVINGNTGGEDDDDTANPYFSATAGSSAANANYNVSVEQLAQGSKAKSGTFTGNDQVISASGGNLTFATANGESTFDINVEAGATLQDIANAINGSDDNFGVSASIVNTGGANPETRLIFSSSVTGEENELEVTNDNAELDVLSTQANAGGAGGMSIADTDQAQDARMIIDGIEVFSSSNTFENAIDGVTLEATQASPGQNQSLSIRIDKEGVREEIDDFVENYNSFVERVNALTKANPDDPDSSGALIGDSMVRGLMSSVSSIVGDGVGSADPSMNTLYSLGLSLDAEGLLEITDDGEERLNDALDNNFDNVSKLFANEDGIASRLDGLIDQYTRTGGLISTREDIFKEQQEDLVEEKDEFDRYMETYEQTLRDRYSALDSMLAQMNQTQQALAGQLGSLPGFGGNS